MKITSSEKAMSTEKQIALASSFRRYAESAAFIAVWMICGWLLRINSASFLVLGVPLVAVFQIAVRH